MPKKSAKKPAKRPKKKAAAKKKPAARKKAAKKAPARKKAAAKAPRKGPRSVRKEPPAGDDGLSADKRIVGADLVGLVADYFTHVEVAAIRLSAPLSVGDTIRIKGHTTDITQKVESMQIDHAPVQAASAGDAVGIRIADRARKGDAVYRV